MSRWFAGRQEIKVRVRCDSISTLSSYKDARYEWETTKPWKNAADQNERPLDSRAKHHMTIRLGSEEEVICALYRTDIVTYWPDGSIEIHPYSTSSTDGFANAILPFGIRTQFTRNVIYLNGNGWQDSERVRVYQANYHFTVVKGADDLWVPKEGQKAEPFVKYVVNRKRAKEALAKYDFARFQAWVIGYCGMNEKDSMQGYAIENERYLDLKKFMAAGPAEWLDWRWRRNSEPGWGRSSWGSDRETTITPQIEYIRMMIYRAEHCVDKVELPYLHSWKELDAIKKSEKMQWY